MKTLQQFKDEITETMNLEDFVLSNKDVRNYESGTRFYQVKTIDGNTGNTVNVEYVLRDIDEADDVLNDMRQVGPGYFTETSNVKRK